MRAFQIIQGHLIVSQYKTRNRYHTYWFHNITLIEHYIINLSERFVNLE